MTNAGIGKGMNRRGPGREAKMGIKRVRKHEMQGSGRILAEKGHVRVRRILGLQEEREARQ